MGRVIRAISGSILKQMLCMTSLVLVAGVGGQATNPAKLVASQPALAGRNYYPEVRLRKLHLVRPDLIPYPIFYDIYC